MADQSSGDEDVFAHNAVFGTSGNSFMAVLAQHTRKEDRSMLPPKSLTRECTNCHQIKPNGNYARTRNGGIARVCKPCMGMLISASKHGKVSEPGHVMESSNVPQIIGDTTVPDDITDVVPLTGPLMALETWLLSDSIRPVSLFITAAYALVRVRGDGCTLYHLLRPQHSPRGEPDSAVEENWLLAMIDLFDVSPQGYVVGR